jgi:hypothetical protein
MRLFNVNNTIISGGVWLISAVFVSSIFLKARAAHTDGGGNISIKKSLASSAPFEDFLNRFLTHSAPKQVPDPLAPHA